MKKTEVAYPVDSFIFDPSKMEDIYEIIGSRVNYYRKEQNLSVDEVANMSNISPNVYYQIVKGKTDFRFSSLLKIISVLNISLDDVIPLVKNINGNKKAVNAAHFRFLTKDLSENQMNLLFDIIDKYVLSLSINEQKKGGK
ncbi:MAG: helix-turn-helix domain-containing protein [Clostridiaceae bacterium]|nr:helix-turn-helix domain-containing protein [Clostridiaceae bacterium]